MPAGVGMDVDEAGGDDQAFGVQLTLALKGLAPGHGGDAPLAQAEVSAKAGPSAAVDDRALADDQVEFHTVPPLTFRAVATDLHVELSKW